MDSMCWNQHIKGLQKRNISGIAYKNEYSCAIMHLFAGKYQIQIVLVINSLTLTNFKATVQMLFIFRS